MGYRDTDSCLKKVGPDEPIFVLRAKDKFMPVVMRMWATLVEDEYKKLGKTMTPKVKEAQVFALEVEDWQKKNQDKVGVPS